MGTSGLDKAVKSGAPLVEVTIKFNEGIDYVAATTLINSLSEELHLHEQPWYNEPRLRVGSATKESLEKLFGWKLKRIPLVLVSEKTGKPEETEFYCWDSENEPQYFPNEIEGLIEDIGYSQPGADDEGQWYE